MPRRTYCIMVLLYVWNIILFLLTAVRTTGSTFSGADKDIMHAIAGNPFIIRRWPMIDSTLFITIKKDKNTILDMSIGGSVATNSSVQNGRMMLVYNQTIQELYLLFENVSKEDGGIYEMEESFYRTNTIPEAETYDRKDGTWYLEIYVLGPSDIKKGYVGGNISMEFERPIKQSTLYKYDEPGALLVGSSCSVLTDSSLYVRLRCANGYSGRMYKITIVNVSQRDAGLYKIATGRNETWRCFFSIEDSPTCAVIGDKMTIGWFYNQQGIKRTLRVIHPNQGVMMLLHQTNFPQIKSSFRHRLLYNGDTLQSFMLFTLLNVRQSDAGLYTIETLHGNTIPGSKKLNVERTTGGGIQTTDDDVTTKISVTKLEVVTVQPMERQCTCTTGGGIQTTDDDVTTKISVTKLEVVTVQPMQRQCVPIHVVLPVIMAMAVVIFALIVSLIWIQHRKRSTLEADRYNSTVECGNGLYITPIGGDSLPPIPLMKCWT